MTTPIRLAAAGDIHAVEPLREHMARAFSGVADESDLVLLAGDLTTHGLPEQAVVLADACRHLSVPVVAVLGNHDHHSGQSEEVVAVLESAGIRVLDRDHVILEIRELEIGIVGAKGFVGGFPGAEIPDFGDRSYGRYTWRRLSRWTGSSADSRPSPAANRRIVLMHYAPVTDTLVGEPERIWAFLGSGRLAAPIGMHRPDLVVHGHAHHGSPRGSVGEVPVHNVAVQVSGEDFVRLEL